MKKKTREAYRSAETGEFVTQDEAAENPKTTVKETVPIPERRPETDEGEAGFSVEHDWSKPE
jgi:hypothetical protein